MWPNTYEIRLAETSLLNVCNNHRPYLGFSIRFRRYGCRFIGQTIRVGRVIKGFFTLVRTGVVQRQMNIPTTVCVRPQFGDDRKSTGARLMADGYRTNSVRTRTSLDWTPVTGNVHSASRGAHGRGRRKMPFGARSLRDFTFNTWNYLKYFLPRLINLI